MFGETFLAKRYAAGREEERSELLKFLEENPGATAKEVEEWARNRRAQRKGEETGKKRRSSRPPFCSGDSEEGKGMGVGDAFLAKRYAAGWQEEVEIGKAQLLKFLEENPGATVDQIRELLRNGDLRRNGDKGGKGWRG